MRSKFFFMVLLASLFYACTPKQPEQDHLTSSTTGELDRTVLPIKEPAIHSTQHWMHATQKHLHDLK